MKIKNIELIVMISRIESLKGLTLDGDVAMAAVGFKSQLMAKMKEVEEVQVNILESLCTKDENGNPIKKNVAHGDRNYFEYDFDTTEAREESNKRINEISDIENEFTISPSKITKDSISKMKLTTDQTEGLLLLVAEPVMATV